MTKMLVFCSNLEKTFYGIPNKIVGCLTQKIRVKAPVISIFLNEFECILENVILITYCN